MARTVASEARREKLQHLELWQKLNAGQLYQVICLIIGFVLDVFFLR